MRANEIAAGLGARQQKRAFVQLLGSPCEAEKMPLNANLARGLCQPLKQSRLLSPAANAAPLDSKSYGDPLFHEGFLLQEEQEDEESFGVENAYSTSTSTSQICSHDDSTDDAFSEFVSPASSASLVSAFLHHVGSTPAMCALVSLHQGELHPVGAGDYCSVDATIAGLLVLCKRGSIRADEMCPELMLTLLWCSKGPLQGRLLESTSSQYRTLNVCLATSLRLHPDRHQLAEHYRRCMVHLQPQVLQRCGWRVLLREPEELFEALADLGSHPDFEPLCTFVEECAEHHQIPLGSHGHSPGAEAVARAARAAASARHSTQQACSGSGDSGKSGHAGLDGSYWQLAADQAPGHSSRQRRAVLGPRNTNI